MGRRRRLLALLALFLSRLKVALKKALAIGRGCGKVINNPRVIGFLTVRVAELASRLPLGLLGLLRYRRQLGDQV